MGSIKVKQKRWKGLNNCMSPPPEPCPDQFGLLISANSIGNICTAKSLQKSREQFASRRKRSPTMDPGSCMSYTIYIYT